MSALNFFNAPKITLKKPSIQLEHSEAQTLNYAIICFLNRDIAADKWLYKEPQIKLASLEQAKTRVIAKQ